MEIIPNISMNERIEAPKMLDGTRLESVNSTGTANFESVLTDLIGNLNEAANAPDKVMNDAMLGQADVHDVMAAIQKSDIEVTMATTIVGKVIQAYEKISQISI